MESKHGPSQLTKSLHRYEQKYRSGDLRGLACRGAALQSIGRSVLVLAPHSIGHRREGREKAAEFYTGALAELCAEAGGWSVLTALREYDDRQVDNSFERAADALVAATRPWLILELHGMRQRWERDVSIGTAGRSESTSAARTLSSQLESRFVTSVDDLFIGSKSVGARVAAHAAGTAVLHVELGPRLRSDTTSEEDLRALVAGFLVTGRAE